MNEKGNKGRWLAFGLGGLQVFIGVGGVAGGFGLVTEPSGSNLGFLVEWLRSGGLGCQFGCNHFFSAWER